MKGRPSCCTTELYFPPPALKSVHFHSQSREINFIRSCHDVIFFFSFLNVKVVSSVSSRLHLNRLSRPDLSLADLSAQWRRNVPRPPPVDWSSIGSRLRLGLSHVKVEVPTIKMPIRSRRGWCGCFQVYTNTQPELNGWKPPHFFYSISSLNRKTNRQKSLTVSSTRMA